MSYEILIVDDIPENLLILSTILRNHGFNVRLAPNGDFALRSVHARHPDLILLDIRMPDMNGFQVCQALRNNPNTHHIPILFLSASQEPEERIQAFQVGGIDFISKPFHAEEVLARVSIQLTLARLRGELASANKLLRSQVVVEQEQRQHAEEVAEDRQARLELVLNATKMGTWSTSESDVHMLCDEQAQAIFNLDQAQLCGGWLALISCFDPGDQASLKATWQNACHHHQTFDLEGWWNKNGVRRRIRIRGRMQSDEAQKSTRTVGLVWDITDEYLMRTRLLHSEKLESMGQLAGGLAHDFNNHLAVILGNIELMRLQLGVDHKCSGRLGNINRAAMTASALVRDMLLFAHRREIVETTISLKEMLLELESLLQSLLSKRIDLKIDLFDTDILIKGNREQLQNAIMNLCINARDAVPETGGKLRITVSRHYVKSTTCCICTDKIIGNYAAITISDNGDGISDALKKRIFEPFFTTKPAGKGTGLGLAAVVGCVKAHHGHMLLESQPGTGASFCMLLPLLDETQLLQKHHHESTAVLS